MKKIASFASIGALNSLFSYAIFSALYLFGLHYLLASVFSFLSGTLLSYVLNARFTFGKEKALDKGILFLLGNLLTLALGLLLLYGFTEFLKIDPLIGQILVIVIRFPINFLFSSKLVFKHHDS
jgi:putative flippase GtrA